MFPYELVETFLESLALDLLSKRELSAVVLGLIESLLEFGTA